MSVSTVCMLSSFICSAISYFFLSPFSVCWMLFTFAFSSNTFFLFLICFYSLFGYFFSLFISIALVRYSAVVKCSGGMLCHKHTNRDVTQHPNNATRRALYASAKKDNKSIWKYFRNFCVAHSLTLFSEHQKKTHSLSHTYLLCPLASRSRNEFRGENLLLLRHTRTACIYSNYS